MSMTLDEAFKTYFKPFIGKSLDFVEVARDRNGEDVRLTLQFGDREIVVEAGVVYQGSGYMAAAVGVLDIQATRPASVAGQD